MHLVHWVNNILRDENVYFKFWNELMRVTSNSASDKNLLAIMIKKYDINAYFEFWNELSADYDVGHFRFVDTMYNRFFTQSGIQSNNCKKCKCYHVAYECSKCNMKCNDCTQPIIIIVIKIPFLKRKWKNYDYLDTLSWKHVTNVSVIYVYCKSEKAYHTVQFTVPVL